VAGVDKVKMILYVEHTVDANDLGTALWRFCNNLDPKRDHIIWQRPLANGHHYSIIGLMERAKQRN